VNAICSHATFDFAVNLGKLVVDEFYSGTFMRGGNAEEERHFRLVLPSPTSVRRRDANGGREARTAARAAPEAGAGR
jgi:hypothetical protein